MTLNEDKMYHYDVIRHGEEFDIEKSLEVFENCLVYEGSAELNKNSLTIIDLTHNDETEYNSMILSTDQAPIITRKTTSLLIAEKREKAILPYGLNKDIVKHLYNKQKVTRFPEIDFNDLFVPLEGAVAKNTHYVNYKMLKDIRKHEDGRTVLSYSDRLEMILPCRNIKRLKQHFDTCLEYYVMFQFNEGHYPTTEELIAHFNEWPGTYCTKRKEAISAGIHKTTRKKYIDQKTLSNTLFLNEEDQNYLANCLFNS